MLVKDVMKREIAYVSPEDNVEFAAKIMDKNNYGALLVKERNRFIGIITERDVLRKVVARGISPLQTKVANVMSSPIITIDGDADLAEASLLMDRRRIRRLAVTINGEISGIVTVRDVLKNLRHISASKLLAREYHREELFQ